MSDDPLAGAAANCAEAYRAWAAGVGRPWRAWDDLVLADLGLPVSLPPNHASVLTPLTDEAVPDVVERMRAFFDGSPGGPFQVWSLWPTPGLGGFGFEPWSVPMMTRAPGGEPRPAPPELEIVEVSDDASAAEASSLLSVFGTPAAATEGLITPALQSDTFRVWLGRAEGNPASIAAASVSHGFVGVYAVATAQEFRGRGYGEALSWVATMFRPDLPANLQASSMGRPVYERMGYETVATFWCWTAERG
ncbi:MAG TPA: GNAT family N-acetyltransferase [Actinomycetota bacterium]|nr:GNAT family N-acetyltransferase [Actinomycetota bacterium]